MNSTDLVLDIDYYDFSYSHADFDDVSDLGIHQPEYINSPYGAWLAISDFPQTDTFSDWFRNVSGTNHNYRSVVLLEQTEMDHFKYVFSYFLQICLKKTTSVMRY